MRIMMLLAISVLATGPARSDEPPSRPGVDAPELAHRGGDAVGFVELLEAGPEPAP